MCIHVYTNIYIYIYIYIYVCICTFEYTYIYIYIHKCIHTYVQIRCTTCYRSGLSQIFYMESYIEFNHSAIAGASSPSPRSSQAQLLGKCAAKVRWYELWRVEFHIKERFFTGYWWWYDGICHKQESRFQMANSVTFCLGKRVLGGAITCNNQQESKVGRMMDDHTPYTLVI